MSTTTSPRASELSTARDAASRYIAPSPRELLAAVRARRSVRTFSGERLRAEHMDVITSYLADPAAMRGPLGGRVRVALLDDVDGHREIGTYGYTKGFRSLLVAIARPEPRALFELAYVLHGLVLHLTHLGVGTVWMGGAFNPADVVKQTRVDAGELIGAIVPLGYEGGHKRLIDYAAPLILKATKRKPVDHSCFLGELQTPLRGRAPSLLPALDVARRAPSAKNRQSWRAVVSADERRVHIYAAFSLRDEVGTGRKQYACSPEYLDVGTWYRSLDIALQVEGLSGTLVVADPQLPVPDGADLEYLATWTRDA
ncbi:MAG: hypothetical protein H6713_38550 [Myxococcales bacterium]|nr:hypothetical protein [Myxococcales bacterium]MCB9755868.1 hypothetical protein [Myxococcales bacterium]